MGEKKSNENLQLFEDRPIRTAWSESDEAWYFSIVDVVGVLTESKDPTAYWRKMKQRLKEEGNETVTNCHGLKMKAADGKRRLTDVANTEQLLRLIQSIPSKKAEPFKLWLAQVGKERIDETFDPELIAERLVTIYERKGYTREWINQRLMAISARKELTDEWKDRGIRQGKEYAILTDELTRAWSGMTTRQYKNLKGLKKESLRDNMSTTELVLNMLAETATKEISEVEQPSDFTENVSVAKQGGKIAGDARKALEAKTGKPVITTKNALELNHVVTQMIEASADVVSEKKRNDDLMNEPIFVCYPHCTTCKKAEKWLADNGIAVQVRDIKEDNPTEQEIRSWHEKSGLPLKRFFNTSGLKYKELGLKDKLSTMSEDEQYALLATDGMLVKRPLLVGDEKVLVGFKEQEWQEKISP